jgi:hypothetical protein
MSHSVQYASAGLALALSLVACAPTEVVLAELPEESDAGPAPKEPPCISNADCDDASFCAKRSCGEPAGRCERRPMFCPPDLDPVCGCDGITYWNECLRRERGLESQMKGECTYPALHCGGPAGPCPSGASCARLLHDGPCPPPDAPGVCWILPTTCAPPPIPAPVFEGCGTPEKCVDACTAIRSERPFRLSGPCR